MEKVKHTIYLPKELKEEIKEMSNEKGISQNALMVLAIQDWIYKKKLKKDSI